MPVPVRTRLIENRTGAILDYHLSSGIMRAELDVSGGVDSAVMLVLLARALGPNNVTAVYSSINSSDESLRRARKMALVAGTKLIELDLTAAVETVLWRAIQNGLANANYDLEEIHERCKADPTIKGSFRSCIRAPVGRYLNRLTGGGIRHGTGNECEDRWLRYYQKGGDGEVDTNPLAMLSKGEVYQMAIGLGVPREIVDGEPTADLWGKGGPVHTDEDELAKFLGVKLPEGHTFYSYVDYDTGEYRTVGLIERVSRFLDTITKPVGKNLDGTLELECALFAPGLDEDDMRRLVYTAMGSPLFETYPMDIPGCMELMLAVRRVERITRHKLNPNIPMLGSRAELLRAGLVSNDLPDMT